MSVRRKPPRPAGTTNESKQSESSPRTDANTDANTNIGQEVRALHAQEKRLLSALRIARVGFVDWDLATNITVWSAETCRILECGEGPLSMPAERLRAYVPDEDAELVDSNLAAAIRGEKPYDIVHRLRCASGESRWVRAQGELIRDDEGNPVRFLGTLTEISDIKRVEADVLHSQRMEAVGQLAGGIAHDFNNLLTVIRGSIDFVGDDVPRDSSAFEDIETIRTATDRASNLTQQLLAFSRRQILHPRPLNLSDAVEHIGGMLRRVIGEDVTIRTRLAERVGAVNIDPTQIDLTLINLAVNARDAMPTGGTLTIETANIHVAEHADHGDVPPGEYVMLQVSDTGCGMSEEVRQQIFEPFFTTKQEGKGTGLGLSTIYGVVTQSGGYIDVASEAGAGTTVRVYLPRLPTADAAGSGTVPPTERTVGTETVLVVEDNDLVRQLAVRILRARGYSVLEASNGDAAIDLVQTHDSPIDLVLSDVVMPGRSGPDAVAAICGYHPEARVIYMSGYIDDSTARHGVTDGSVPFLPKPFHPKDLANKVRDVLDGLDGAKRD